MKRFLCIIITTLLLSLGASADSYKSLNLRLSSGISQVFTLHEPTKIAFEGDSVIVSSQHLSVSYSRNNVLGYFFTSEDETPDAIEKVEMGGKTEVIFRREGSNLTVNGLCKGARIRIFSMNSSEQTPAIVYTESKATIDFSSLPQGVYIVSIKGCPDVPSIKFIN